MGWSPGLKSIHPGSTSEAPIGLIKKTSTREGVVDGLGPGLNSIRPGSISEAKVQAPLVEGCCGLVPRFELDTPGSNVKPLSD